MYQFLVSKKKDEVKINQWFRHCSDNRCPYLRVECRTKYADVKFDSITLTEDALKALQRNMERVQGRAMSIFEKYAIKGSQRTITNDLIYFEDLPRETAEAAASELYDLIAKFSQNNPRHD